MTHPFLAALLPRRRVSGRPVYSVLPHPGM